MVDCSQTISDCSQNNWERGENKGRTRREQNRHKVGYICLMATRGYNMPGPRIGCDKDYLKISQKIRKVLTKWVSVGVVKAEVLSLTYAHIQTAPTAAVPIGPHMPVNVCIGARIYAGCTVGKFAKIVQGTCNVPVVQVACTSYKGPAYRHMLGNALDMLSATQGAAQCTCSYNALKLQVTSQI